MKSVTLAILTLITINAHATEPAELARYNIVWDGRADNGTQVGTGIYFYRLQAGDVAMVKKMIMLK